MKFFLLFFLLLYYSDFLSAQDAPDELTESFAFEVKTIDDFIERFNAEPNTEFLKFLRANYPEKKITRELLITSLFNGQHKRLMESNERLDFIKEMSDTAHPSLLSFSDRNWYVELECLVQCTYCKNKTQRLFLILQVEKKNDAMKWSIVSTHAVFLGKYPGAADNLRLNDSTRYFLHPMSHALDFMNIDEPFLKKKHFRDYVYDGPRTIQLGRLISRVSKSEVKFIRLNTISYHFLQLNGWIVRVDFFNRYAKNSGWLINKLSRVSPDDVKKYLKGNLNIPTKD